MSELRFQAHHLRQQKMHQSAVQAQGERRDASLRVSVSGQFSTYTFRTLPQPTAVQTKHTRLPLRGGGSTISFRVPERDDVGSHSGALEFLSQEAIEEVDSDGERSADGGHAGDQDTSSDGGSANDGQPQGQGDDSSGDEARGGERDEAGRGEIRSNLLGDLACRMHSRDRCRDWLPSPNIELHAPQAVLAHNRTDGSAEAKFAESAHALAFALISIGAQNVPPGGFAKLRFTAMAAYIDAQSTSGALAMLGRVKELLLSQAVTIRAVADSPSGVRMKEHWALLPLMLLNCDRPRTKEQRKISVERLNHAQRWSDKGSYSRNGAKSGIKRRA